LKKSGSITVFTSLFLAVFLLVFQVLLQSVQIGGGRVQAETGVEEGLRVITDAKSYLSYIGKTVTLAQATGLEDMMAQMEAYQ